MGTSVLSAITNNFSFRVVVDILVVSFIIYKVLSLFQKTSAMSIVKGLAVIVGVNIVANLFNLDALQWMVQQLTTVTLVAIPVVFQPELRHALERIGSGELFLFNKNTKDSDKTEEVINMIVKAAYFMSSKSIGALIVIERDMDTETLIRVGVKLDAEVSYDLLVNIFTPKTPLHDGAVVIKDNKISAASCVLPLSTKPFKSRKIGTRHRAAMGITEETDALALVVSEETGLVSVAEDGEFWPEHTEPLILQRLKDKLVVKKASKWSFKRGERK